MKRNLVGKILGKIKIFVQDFVPIRTALRARASPLRKKKNYCCNPELQTPTNFLNILYIFCICTNIILVLPFLVPKYFFPPGGIASSSFLEKKKTTGTTVIRNFY